MQCARTYSRGAQTLAECASKLAAEGAVFLPKAAAPETLDAIRNVMEARMSRVLSALGDAPLGIGSQEGYKEIVQRSPGRFDVPLDAHELSPVWGHGGLMADAVPWLELMRLILGPAVAPLFCGVVVSRPGSPSQQWHIDSPHESRDLLPAHAVNVMLPLRDVPLEAGPTEVALGSHSLTNHLAAPWLDRNDLLYQTQTEITPYALLRADSATERTKRMHFLAQAVAAGDALVFDDRVLHRGLANHSRADRWVAYFSYYRPRKSQGVNTHFESTRSVFDVVDTGSKRHRGSVNAP